MALLLLLLASACRPSADGCTFESLAGNLMQVADIGSGLLFRSGFEGNSALESIPTARTNDYYQHFSGADCSTGFTWPFTFWGANAVSTGIHAIAGSTNTVGKYINNTIETVDGPHGTPTRALKMEVFNPAPGFCCIQSMFQVAGMSQQVTDAYTRFWIKLNPELRSQVQANTNEFWRTLWVLKTYNDYRISTFVVGTRGGVPRWRVIVDNNPNGVFPTCPANACWRSDVDSVPVPTDRWFLMEVYLHRSKGDDGRFFWAVDGQVLVDRYGPSYGAYQENISFLAISGLYGNEANMSPAYQWIDDVEVWERPPCGTLPCGPAPNISESRP